MLKKLARLFTKKESETAVRRRLAEKLNDMHFGYITEKAADGNDIIIGRDGHLNLIGEKKEQLCATCGVKTLFRLEVSQMRIWEFMSLDGCVITFTDLESGAERTVNVYYDKHLERR